MGEPWAVIWDLDGTLVDTGALHFAAWQRIAAELGKTYSAHDFAITFGRRNPEIIRQIFNPKATEDEVAMVGDLKEELYRAAARAQGVALLPGARHLLDQIAQAGGHQGIGSSAPRKNVEQILEVAGLQAYLRIFVCMEDTARGKPDPEVFFRAAERLGVAPARCVVIEDAVAGVQGAKAAGMAAIGVAGGGHHSIAALRHAGADLAVASLEEVTLRQLQAYCRGDTP